MVPPPSATTATTTATTYFATSPIRSLLETRPSPVRSAPPSAAAPSRFPPPSLSDREGSHAQDDRMDGSSGVRATMGGEGGRASEGQAAVDLEAARMSEEEKQVQRNELVMKVLKKAETAKIIRTFQHRIALAAFKASRGWQDVTLDVIEPHLEQEANKRRIAEERETQDQQQGQSQRQQQSRHQDMQLQMQMELQHQQQQHRDEQQRVQQQSMRGGPSNTNGGMMGPPKSLKRVRGGSLANASMANTTMYEPPRHFGGSNEDHYAASFSPHAHTSPYQSIASTSTLQPSAYLMGSPYQGSPVADSHRHKRRPSDFTSPQRASQSSHVQPSPRTSSKHVKSRSISKVPATDNGVTLSDPSFSSFVDAATALTGLSRAPSEATLPGSNSDEEQRAGVDGTLGGGSTGTRSGTPPFGTPFSPFPTSTLPISSTTSTNFLHRPQTPERGSGSVQKGKGPENTSDAAELMLFLAASPSPAQGRREPTTLGASSGGMKGRLLFGGIDDSSHLSPSSHSPSQFSHPPPQSSSIPSTSITSMTKSGGEGLGSSYEYDSKVPRLSSPTPSTPSRERVTSFGNGGSGGWDSYLNVNVNVSPSPGRREFGGAEGKGGVSVDGRGW